MNLVVNSSESRQPTLYKCCQVDADADADVDADADGPKEEGSAFRFCHPECSQKKSAQFT